MSKLNMMAIYVACLIIVLPIAGNAQDCRTDIPATTPTIRFTDNADGTVTDKKTGLMWKKCVEGRTGDDCSGGSEAAYTWQMALQQAQTVNTSGGFAGFADWRLPNIKELYSIVERQCSPAINLTLFPNIFGSFLWSSSMTDDVNYVRIVEFGYGFDSAFGIDYSASVRLVRGGQ